MGKATLPGGDLAEIPDCYIQTPGYVYNLGSESAPALASWNGKIPMKIIPDISDSKGAVYGDESVIGRSHPIKTFSHGENRAISWTAHFIVCKDQDIYDNLFYLRAIESLVYPRTHSNSGVPYMPPPVCTLICGNLLAGHITNVGSGGGASGFVCAVLKNYDVKFAPDVPWDEKTKLPYKFSVGMSWEVVYRSSDLPGQERIMYRGR